MYAHTIHINKHTHMYMYKHLRLQQRISSGHDKSRHLSLGADSTQPPATDYKHTHTHMSNGVLSYPHLKSILHRVTLLKNVPDQLYLWQYILVAKTVVKRWY